MSYVGNVTADGVTHLVGSTLYGTCTDTAATAAKTVTCANFDKLIAGVTIHVKFTNTNTAANPTLNVNDTGAEKIYRYGTTAPSTTAKTSWNAGTVVAFTYDGANWMMNDWLNDDTTYSTATQSAAGLMSAEDKKLIDNVLTSSGAKALITQGHITVPKDGIEVTIPHKVSVLICEGYVLSGDTMSSCELVVLSPDTSYTASVNWVKPTITNNASDATIYFKSSNDYSRKISYYAFG